MKLTPKQFRKDWGKRCKTFSPLCTVCIAYHAYDSLVDLYQVLPKSKKGYKM